MATLGTWPSQPIVAQHAYDASSISLHVSPGNPYQAPVAHEHTGDGSSPYESLVYDSMGFSSMNLESVWSMFPEAYCVNFPCELKMTSAISQSHRMLHSDKKLLLKMTTPHPLLRPGPYNALEAASTTPRLAAVQSFRGTSRASAPARHNACPIAEASPLRPFAFLEQ